MKIFDSHIHLWDLKKLDLPWLQGRSSLKKDFLWKDLAQSYEGYELEGAVFVETDCADKLEEDIFVNEHFYTNCPKAAYVAGGILSKTMRLSPHAIGFREVLHNENSRDFKELLKGLELLEDKGLIFELCARPRDLLNIAKELKSFPKLKVVLNHLGNVNELKEPGSKELDKDFKAAIELLAQRELTWCKLSGLSDNLDKLAVLDFFSQTFSKYKLLYASNFPVNTLYQEQKATLTYLLNYYEKDENIFSKNAKKLYKINPKQRFAQSINLHKDKIEEYVRLHAAPFEGVNKMIKNCGITSYEIYLKGSKLFAVFDYEGDDFDFDMQEMAKDEGTRFWWQHTDPCQYRLKGAGKDEWWSDLKLVYKLK